MRARASSRKPYRRKRHHASTTQRAQARAHTHTHAECAQLPRTPAQASAYAWMRQFVPAQQQFRPHWGPRSYQQKAKATRYNVGARAARSIGLGVGLPTSYISKLSSSTCATGSGHLEGNGLASSKDAYCGGIRHVLAKDACVHMGGTDTVEQLSNKSLTQNPGHITNGKTHICKHTGTLPPTGTISSRLCGVVHRGNTEEHIMPM